jgi:hypothetical protein
MRSSASSRSPSSTFAEIQQCCPAAREIRQFSHVATHLLCLARASAFLTDVPCQRPPAAADGAHTVFTVW